MSCRKRGFGDEYFEVTHDPATGEVIGENVSYGSISPVGVSALSSGADYEFTNDASYGVVWRGFIQQRRWHLRRILVGLVGSRSGNPLLHCGDLLLSTQHTARFLVLPSGAAGLA